MEARVSLAPLQRYLYFFLPQQSLYFFPLPQSQGFSAFDFFTIPFFFPLLAGILFS